MVALIVSVGGSADPVIKTIANYTPLFVCFFASEDSVEKIGPIKERLAELGIPVSKDRKVIVSNPENLIECYEEALKCGILVEEQGFSKADVVADFTCGTKAMSSGLVLATVSKGYRFSYVGGEARTKQGLGTVVPGTESLKETPSPWDVLALRDRERFEWCFNAHDYEVALEMARDISARPGISSALRVLFQGFIPLIEAYYKWDRFAHSKDVLALLRQGLERLQDYQSLNPQKGMPEFVSAVATNKDFFERMLQESRGFSAASVSVLQVYDLLGNAVRRADEGRYDDAVARLYRALEMYAQSQLLRRSPPINTSNVDIKVIPESIRAQFQKKYGEPGSDCLKIPLRASYQLLSELGDSSARLFFENEGDVNKILSARNSSILAHGSQIQSRENFSAFLQLLERLLPGEYPLFPVMKLTSA